jgi:hypothetical protein
MVPKAHGKRCEETDKKKPFPELVDVNMYKNPP